MTNFLYLNEFGDALLVRHEGAVSTLPTLQTLVEGWVQYVPADEDETGIDADIWVNEEGLYQPTFTVNLLASLFAGQRLVGPAVISRRDDDCETVGLSKDDFDLLTRNGLQIDYNGGQGFTADEAVAIRTRLVTR
jgi:hypothetical protein